MDVDVSDAGSEMADCRYIASLVYQHSGICLPESKNELIKARLGKRWRQRGLKSFQEYCRHLRRGMLAEELGLLVDALTTNYTQFLREPDHFEFLFQKGLPESLRSGMKRFEIWSAACATGEEPYSIALGLAEHYPPSQDWDWRVFATDISQRALALARRGIYERERLGTVPLDWVRKHFQEGTGEWNGYCRVAPELAARVCFQRMNLLQAPVFRGRFTAIFCRNVMIYFDRKTQECLMALLMKSLQPGGWLLVGHSESLAGLSTGLRPLRPSIYQRV